MNTLTTEEHTKKHSGPIKTYRELTPCEISVINEFKELENQLGQSIARVRLLQENNPDIELDPRWVSIARTQLQQGFMSLNRSVAKPVSDL